MGVDPGLIFKILSHIRQHGGTRETGLHYQDIAGDYTYAQVDYHVKQCVEQGLIISRDVLSRDWAIVSLTQKGWDSFLTKRLDHFCKTGRNRCSPGARGPLIFARQQ